MNELNVYPYYVTSFLEAVFRDKYHLIRSLDDFFQYDGVVLDEVACNFLGNASSPYAVEIYYEDECFIFTVENFMTDLEKMIEVFLTRLNEVENRHQVTVLQENIRQKMSLLRDKYGMHEHRV